MMYSKKMYLLSPSDLQMLKENKKKIDSEDIQLNKTNENLIQGKILNRNEKDKAWQTYGNEMQKVIKKSIDDTDLAANLPNLASASLPGSIPPLSSTPMPSDVSFIKLGVGVKLVNKVSRFYNLLQSIQQTGISVNPQQIFLDGSPVGGTLEILKSLVSSNKYLRLPLDEFLARIADHPQIVNLISNRQAKEFLQTILGPESTGVAKSLNFELENEEESNIKTGSGLNRKKKKRKIKKWATLF